MRLPEASPSAIGLLRVLLAATLLVPLGLFVFASWLNYRAAIRDADMDLLRSGEVAREFAAKVFDGQSQVVDRVTDLIHGMDVPEITRAQKPLHEAFAGITAHLPQVQSVLLVDRAGHPLVSAGTYPVPAADVSARDYFRAVTGGYQGVYVSSLQTGDVNRRLFFGVARPWLAADGAIDGVIDVAVSPAFFHDFFEVVIGEGSEGAEGKNMALVRDDGQVLARFPDAPGPAQQISRDDPFFAAVASNPDVGTFFSHAIADRDTPDRDTPDRDTPDRLHAYRKVQGYPIYVVAGRNYASILAGWRETMASHLIFGLPATVALFLITWTALVRAKREEDALARARLEMQRRETAEQALLRAQRLEAVGQLTGGVAHDFNNLLTLILGSAELLTRRAHDPQRVCQIAEQIALAAKRGGDVTAQLLAFSRRQFISPETIDLNQRLRDFRELLERAAREKVRLSLSLQDGLPPARLDAGHFESAVLNLVGNARDAMPTGGQIRIATSLVVLPAGAPAASAGRDGWDLPPGRYIRVSVADDGTGMEPQTAAKAFEPFFTTKEIGKGTGLGLSQVYGFAKQAGGDARIRTAPGKGTTVELLLPCAPAPEPPRPPPAAPDVADGTAQAAGKVVLIVEDEPGVLGTVTECLQDIGYRTISAGSAADALARLQADGQIDLLFSDMMMPGGMDGWELSVEARRLRPSLKVLLTSGYSAALDREPAHGVKLLAKPYDRQQLAERLQAALHG